MHVFLSFNEVNIKVKLQRGIETVKKMKDKSGAGPQCLRRLRP